MARLPEPVLDKLVVEWADKTESKKRNETFISLLAEAVREGESKKREEIKP